ncbi:MAG: hypothetical protein AAGA83_00730 [Cyanobacteria bacterium P01_F01_bin.116]
MNLQTQGNIKNVNQFWKIVFTIAAITLTNHSISNRSKAFAFSLTSLSQKTGFEHESTDLIKATVYARSSSTYSHMALDGSNRANQDYANGLSDIWYIEEQRFGADAIISGLIHNDQQAIDAGFQMFDWGFTQQQNDGGFLPTQDPFHSTSMFLGSVAYSLLTLQESIIGELYNDIIESYLPKLQLAGQWMIQEEVWTTGNNNNSPYTHRNYSVATTLGLTGKLTGDQTLIEYANQSIHEGLNKQLSNGVNPEKGGHDSSYQMAGALHAMRWLTHFSTDALAAGVAEMINNSLIWEESMILPSGAVSTEGNTRTNGTEITRLGKPKGINQREIIHGFAYWSSITGDKHWETNAHNIARYYYPHDSLVMSNLDQLYLLDLQISTTNQDVPESSQMVGIILTGLIFFCSFSKQASEKKNIASHHSHKKYKIT